MSNNTESISDKLRRWSDESENDNRRHFYPTFNAYDDLCIEVREDDCISERELFRRIADEIDAEKQSALRNCAYPLTQEVGKPLKGDEDFKSWLDRYYLPRPLFEDGEPVQFDDECEHGKLRETRYRWCYDIPKRHLVETTLVYDDESEVELAEGERVKRPEQQVLDADGVPIEVGDELWSVEGDGPWTVIAPFVGTGKTLFDDGEYASPDWLTHREPDNQESIDNDVTVSPFSYCVKHGLVNGYHDMSEARKLMVRDLLRRQRELDGRDA